MIDISVMIKAQAVFIRSFSYEIMPVALLPVDGLWVGVQSPNQTL